MNEDEIKTVSHVFSSATFTVKRAYERAHDATRMLQFLLDRIWRPQQMPQMTSSMTHGVHHSWVAQVGELRAERDKLRAENMQLRARLTGPGFGEEPDAPLHGECAAEIERLGAENASLKEQMTKLVLATEVVKTVILHELGHAMGLGNIDGTIMDAELVLATEVKP